MSAGSPLSPGGITDVPGIHVGHTTDPVGATGCTVVLPVDGAVAGVAVRGGAPGTRETDALQPGTLVDRIHGVLLTGGSAFGLAAADGVLRWLEERGVGFDTGAARVPVVPGAVIFDLGIGDPRARPGPAEGYAACSRADAGPIAEGSVGAGTGATVGKLRGRVGATKGGVGTASLSLPNGVVVGALVVVNGLGDVVDPASGRVVAGVRDERGWLHSTDLLLRPRSPEQGGSLDWPPRASATTIGVVATNAGLSKEHAARVAQVAHDGLALAVRPAHLLADGDTIFALATGSAGPADVSLLGVAAAEVVARACVRAVLAATALAGVLAARDLQLDGRLPSAEAAG